MTLRLTLPLLCLLPCQVQAEDQAFPMQPTQWQLTLSPDLNRMTDNLGTRGLSKHFMLPPSSTLAPGAEQDGAIEASLQPHEQAYQQQRKTLLDRCGSGLQGVAAKRFAAHGTVSLAPCTNPRSGIGPLQRLPGVAMALPE